MREGLGEENKTSFCMCASWLVICWVTTVFGRGARTAYGEYIIKHWELGVGAGLWDFDGLNDLDSYTYM